MIVSGDNNNSLAKTTLLPLAKHSTRDFYSLRSEGTRYQQYYLSNCKMYIIDLNSYHSATNLYMYLIYAKYASHCVIALSKHIYIYALTSLHKMYNLNLHNLINYSKSKFA